MEEKKNSGIDAVSFDKNWRTRVKNEKQSADQWQQDWGFLASSNKNQKEDALKIFTIDDKIRKAQEELKLCKHDGNWFTSNSIIGSMKDIEKFRTTENF